MEKKDATEVPTPAPQSNDKTGRSAKDTQSLSWKFVGGVVVLSIWVIALGIYGVDRAFHLGFFPTRLERHLTDYREQLTDQNPEVRKKAEQGLFSYHGFSVPILIQGLRSGSEERKAACARCLRRIAEYYYGARPHYGIDADKWERWWEKVDRAMVEQMDRQADEQQAKRQEWASRQR
ncbi:MAG: hypothetical protein GXP25_11990 [Planctomycetes bacterium]|nr:hypothetical protein [Planctomycetota bacterium]